MSVAVVILNWNGRDMLAKYLPSVVEFSSLPGVEIVVADNGSTDDSLDYLSEKFPMVRQIILPENYGFAEGYNRALRQIDADYFVLLNSDVEVTANWLSPLYNYLEAHEDVVACQPKIRSVVNPEYFEHAGAAGGFLDKYAYPFCRGRIFSEVEKDEGQYDTVKEVFWATGACLFIRAKDYFDAGGLDGTFFAHMEEIDLCWRLRSRGKQIVCHPESVVYHYGGGTLNVDSPRKTFLNFRNNLLMIYKNQSEKTLFKILFVRFFLDLLAAMMFLVKMDWENFKSVLKAIVEFYCIKAKYKAKREENLSLQIEQNVVERWNGSIVWAFYAKKVKKFSDLIK
ncbi:MAG: glycosyltransferase family 2 protein [Paludibacteraceae bacterium]|nr:glycosyltransferase family 2 protein [Paludibacteraceae bacterium]